MRSDGIAYMSSSAWAQPSGRYSRPSCAPVSRFFCWDKSAGFYRQMRHITVEKITSGFIMHDGETAEASRGELGDLFTFSSSCTRNKGASGAEIAASHISFPSDPPFCSSIRNWIITNGGQVAFPASKWAESPSSSGPRVANPFPTNAGVGLCGRETLIRACYCVSDSAKVMLILCHNGAREDKGK